jgi:hypothetical protein
MGVNLWGANPLGFSPLYEFGTCLKDSIPNVVIQDASTRRRQLRGGDDPWRGSLRCSIGVATGSVSLKLRGNEQKRDRGSGSHWGERAVDRETRFRQPPE